MDTTNLLVLALQGIGAVFLVVIGVGIKKISSDSDENRKSIEGLSTKVGDLALKMSEHYVTKDDWHATREKVHELTERVMELRTLSQMHRRGTGD